ncbi:MAG: hypothetical protein MUC29_03990 [Pyrinomonadaceae bacterium]|jgi:hypothetical protein|nr:hypothetical protein [Pyrinomonadaceae bacterium]
MKIKVLVFLAVFVFSVTTVWVSKKIVLSFLLKNESECQTKPFSKKHYLTEEIADSFVGKSIKNLECGKIKCATGSGDCAKVKVGEFGKVVGLSPRDGVKNNYLLVVRWENVCGSGSVPFSERNRRDCLSYIGNDGTFEIVK